MLPPPLQRSRAVDTVFFVASVVSPFSITVTHTRGVIAVQDFAGVGQQFVAALAATWRYCVRVTAVAHGFRGSV